MALGYHRKISLVSLVKSALKVLAVVIACTHSRCKMTEKHNTITYIMTTQVKQLTASTVLAHDWLHIRNTVQVLQTGNNFTFIHAF